MTASNDQPAVALPALTQDGRARAEARQGAASGGRQAASVIDFHSLGRLLVLGGPARAQRAVRMLAPDLQIVWLRPPAAAAGDEADAAAPEGVILAAGRLTRLDGYLGRFSAAVAVDDQELNPAQLLGQANRYFDLVLDLQPQPAIPREVPPLGYFAPGDDEQALRRALEQLPELVGEFEKPKFFEYDPAICAHGASGLSGCSRCLDACPTVAIRSIGDRIEVDANLCQGGGSCATACPTGAIRYVYPAVNDFLDSLRQALQRYRGYGGASPAVVFHDAEAGAEAFRSVAAALPERVLPFEVEEAGSLGMDAWLTALAYGADQVLILVTGATPPSVLRELSLQLSYAWAILEGMGYARERLQLFGYRDPDESWPIHAAGAIGDGAAMVPGTFAAFDEKRTMIRLAVDHLHEHAPQARPLAALPAGAPFGEVWVDAQNCTLCMACASQCPTGALLAGDGRPQLRFLEQNCVQCGLCARSCPEDAIGPSPRYLYDAGQRARIRVLYEEEPFRCVSCGKPFASQKVVARMTQKLHNHWMFQDEAALRRLKMCEECRVIDLFEHGNPDAYGRPQ
ncbi:MAG: 4Fe-4S binding protein [Gammaproteobacteria bacterium]